MITSLTRHLRPRRALPPGLVLLVAVLLPSAAARAQTPEFTSPCEVAPITDFDFWVGEWVAFDYTTGVAQGFDTVRKTNYGCTIMQDWTQLTDRFRVPGAPYRYAGVSLNSVLSDGRWQQVWVGNGGGTITLQGGLDPEVGGMRLVSESTGRNGVRNRQTWFWVPQDDGTVHSWGETETVNSEGEWTAPVVAWNLRYVPRHAVRNLKEGG